MKVRIQKVLPRIADLEFTWVTRELGSQWDTWRTYAAAWMAIQDVGLGVRLGAMRAFFEDYLHGLGLPPEPSWLLRRTSSVPDFYDTAGPKSRKGISYSNLIRDLLNWVLEHHFSEPDDYGRLVVLPDYHNPIPWRSMRGLVRLSESVHSPLPYRFIRELTDILAPGLHFRDWGWAQKAGDKSDWFAVRQADLDPDDPDCIWRRRKRREGEILEMWSPVRSVALLVKLTLPLRTYQVRMLDSGEADTWRYTSKGWVENRGRLASGDKRRPVQRGVFRRIQDMEADSTFVGFYINTNKTADIYKEGDEQGYVIPWQHDKLLYWLEKLRNWQEKFNPVSKMTAWTELDVRHLKVVKSAKQLASMPHACFLFRDASISGDDRAKPLGGARPESVWYKLLTELEQRCADRGETTASGQRLKFVAPDSHLVTLFPLHSLRVSLLTCLALDAEVPLVVLSKLVAGHSRIMMTLYYTKPGIARMTRLLNEASEKLDATASEGLHRLLAEATYDQVADRAVFNSLESFRAAMPERH